MIIRGVVNEKSGRQVARLFPFPLIHSMVLLSSLSLCSSLVLKLIWRLPCPCVHAFPTPFVLIDVPRTER